MAITTSGTSITFNDSTTQTSAYTTPDVQTFNSSGTWTKPTGKQMCRIQVWAGGGGGGRSGSANNTCGGGGGEYTEFTVPLSYLASSVSITVGSGGTGATVNAVQAGAGGSSSVPLATAFGGVSTISASGGTGGNDGNFGPGTGGGSLISVYTYVNVSCTGYVVASSLGDPGGAPTGNPVPGKDNVFGGGGGGYGPSTAPRAGNSLWGGGGGHMTGKTAGTSKYGGAGGAGAAGTQPAGGGGSSSSGNTNGFAGGAGRVIITSY